MKSQSGQIVCKHPRSGSWRTRSEVTPPPPVACPPWYDSPPCIPQNLTSLHVLSTLINNLVLPLCSEVIFSYYLAISDVTFDFCSIISFILLENMAICRE
ncbi:hypothetical protein VPH35_020659 [Triticum aestivum]|uniref:Uncharacterized protein n=1 Tax=Triticum urartu TaxID=4572 RepID=A0A8R7TFW7_TRIUA